MKILDDPDRTAPVPLATGQLGMRLLLASLGMLFAACVSGLLYVRSIAKVWPPEGMPSLPTGLWLSTVILLVSSATVQWAVSAARHDEKPGIRHGMFATFALGVAFLVSQTVNWFVLVAAAFTPKANLYAFTYYLLTGLHALHVLGGLVPVGVVTARAFRGAYSAARHSGVEYVAMYWHFLDVVWVVLFIVLYLAG